MSTIVYQELQPCYESHFVESRRLSLKLNTPRANLPHFVGLPQTSTNCNQDLGLKSDSGANNKTLCSQLSGWGSIEALSRSDRESGEKDQPVYIHPLVKKSYFALSQKSLEMCTESLGCETGSSFTESSIVFQPTNEAITPRPKLETKKKVNHVELPPPLTTISGSNAIRVRPYREHGRLVIEAVSAPPKDSYLQVERCEGRLKLSLVRDYSYDIDMNICSSDYEGDNSCDFETTENNEPECYSKNEEGREQGVGNVVKKRLGNNVGDENLEEDINGIKMGLGKIQRMRRCKEGSQRLIRWEPFWVAT